MKFFFWLSLLVILMSTACGDSRLPTRISDVTPAESHNGLDLIVKDDNLSIWATESDRQTARDIHDILKTSTGRICADLQTECGFPIQVEVYPNQASFDEHVINPGMRGFFAISGQPHIIQMVSPANPAPHTISYQDGVSVAAHEFTHLALNEVNADIPTWLEEGTAVYIGPHQLYTDVCQQAFPFELIPPFRQLEEDYNGVQAPDLFAYTAVDFIVSQYGMEELNQILRAPERLDSILNISEETFEEDWQNFIQTQYQNHQTKVFSNS